MANIRYGYERWIDGSAGNTEVVNAGLHALIFTSTRPHIENVPFLVLASISTSILQKSDNSDLIIFLSPGVHWLCRPFFSCCLSAPFKITRFAPQCLGVVEDSVTFQKPVCMTFCTEIFHSLHELRLRQYSNQRGIFVEAQGNWAERHFILISQYPCRWLLTLLFLYF